MSTGYVQEGDVLDFVAPAGGVANGKLYIINGFVLQALTDAAVGVSFAGRVDEAVLDVPKTSAQAWAVGQDVFLDQTNHVADTDPAKGPRIGHTTAVAANPSATGRVYFDANVRAAKFEAVAKGLPATVSLNTAGPATFTIAQLLSGLIVRDTNGASRTDVLPTAALVVAGLANPQVGDQVRCKIINGADAAETITLQEGTGGTWDANFVATKVIGQNAAREVVLRLTNVGSGTEAYVVYLA
jgi:predicted RecA/RadA family phage recombinase